MFLSPKLATIIFAVAAVSFAWVPASDAQNNLEYQRRLQAMQNARTRVAVSNQPVRTADLESGYDFADPPEPVARMARGNAQANQQYQPPRRMARQRPQLRSGNRNYVPSHLRVSQLVSDSPVVDTGAPIVESGVPMMDSPIMGNAPTMAGDGGCEGCESCGGVGGSISMGGCDGCGYDYFDACCDVGGCPPGSFEDFWQKSCIAKMLLNAEYAIGTTGFRSPSFQVPGSNQTVQDSNFGFYGSFNVGVPLCRLTGGLLSGQIGLRSVQTNFNGHPFSSDSRDQMYVTAGLYRRVDYGLQFGIVTDIMQEEWFVESDVIQIRGDVGWVYGNGSIFGFRFADANSGDITEGIFNGNRFTGLNIDSLNHYNFYYRYNCPGGGYSEAFLGWGEDAYTVMGLNCDMPINQCTAMQAGWTYFASDDTPQTSFAGNSNDAWNLYLGLAWRPRGNCWYKYYDRPMFNVADNGTMILRRN